MDEARRCSGRSKEKSVHRGSFRFILLKGSNSSQRYHKQARILKLVLRQSHAQGKAFKTSSFLQKSNFVHAVEVVAAWSHTAKSSQPA